MAVAREELRNVLRLVERYESNAMSGHSRSELVFDLAKITVRPEFIGDAFILVKSQFDGRAGDFLLVVVPVMKSVRSVPIFKISSNLKIPDREIRKIRIERRSDVRTRALSRCRSYALRFKLRQKIAKEICWPGNATIVVVTRASSSGRSRTRRVSGSEKKTMLLTKIWLSVRPACCRTFSHLTG